MYMNPEEIKAMKRSMRITTDLEIIISIIAGFVASTFGVDFLEKIGAFKNCVIDIWGLCALDLRDTAAGLCRKGVFVATVALVIIFLVSKRNKEKELAKREASLAATEMLKNTARF